MVHIEKSCHLGWKMQGQRLDRDPALNRTPLDKILKSIADAHAYLPVHNNSHIHLHIGPVWTMQSSLLSSLLSKHGRVMTSVSGSRLGVRKARHIGPL